MEISAGLLSMCLPLALLLAIAIIKCRNKLVLAQSPPFPPGPPADPFIGNLRHIPREYPWLTYSKWGKKWGGIVYANVLGKSMVVINDLKIARDLMDKRGSIYSDRPRLVLFCEMMGWDKILSFLPYGEKFRRHRRMMQQHFNSQAVSRFRPIQKAELYTLLENLIKSPDDYSHHIFRATAGALTMATYGYPVISDYDPYVMLVEKTAAMTIALGAPGGTLVDFVPALRHIPTWFPGANFKRHAMKTRKNVDNVLNMPYDFVERMRAEGKALPSFASYLLDECDEKGTARESYEEDVRDVSGIIFSAGFETSRAVLLTFVFAMLRFPEVAKRAQADIDAIVGSNRMPSSEDRDSLPFVTAILKECLRWCPPVPLGMPHCLTDSDVYCGMQLPAKSMVVANIWQFMHDERYYPHPEVFNPNRFLQKMDNGLSEEDYNPLNVVFGFGRRVCPGRFFAEQGLWLTMASVLAAFEIQPPRDDSGREYMPKIEFTTGTGSQPVDFKCRFTPRNESYVKLIQQERGQEYDA